jgi:hypothetical protein
MTKSDKFESQSVSVFFDYLDGEMDNTHYQLDKVLKHLSIRKDIEFINDSILDIPPAVCDDYDNARTSYLRFLWYPSVETYRELCARMSSGDEDIYMAIRSSDILGLEKFRIEREGIL